jgi:hypothetical protein
MHVKFHFNDICLIRNLKPIFTTKPEDYPEVAWARRQGDWKEESPGGILEEEVPKEDWKMNFFWVEFNRIPEGVVKIQK